MDGSVPSGAPWRKSHQSSWLNLCWASEFPNSEIECELTSKMAILPIFSSETFLNRLNPDPRFLLVGQHWGKLSSNSEMRKEISVSLILKIREVDGGNSYM